MKKFLRILGILIVLIAAFFVVKTQTTLLNFFSTPEVTTLANPASVYCIQQSGTLEIVDETGGQVGMCHLPGGIVCEEWAYMRGECPKLIDFETNVLVLLPSDLYVEVENLINSLEIISGNLQSTKTTLKEIIDLIKKDLAPVEQEVKVNEIDPIDMDEIIMPNICNIAKNYNVVIEECSATGIVATEQDSGYITYTNSEYGFSLQYPNTREIYEGQPPFELPLLTWMRFQDKTGDGIIRVAISIYNGTYASFEDFQSWYKSSVRDTMTTSPIKIKIGELDAIETMQNDGIDSVSPYIYIPKNNNTIVFTSTNGTEGKALLLKTLTSLKFID